MNGLFSLLSRSHRPAPTAGRQMLPEAALWMAGLISLFLATKLHTPLFLSWRAGLPALVFGGSSLILVTLLVHQRLAWHHRRADHKNSEQGRQIGRARTVRTGVLLLLWLAVPLTGLRYEREFSEHRQHILSLINAGQGAEFATARQLGAHFIIGYRNTPTVRALAESGLIGGIFLSAQNVRGRDLVDIQAEIADLQLTRAAAGLPPLIVSADQEGGIVSRLSPPLTLRPSLSQIIADQPLADIEKSAYAYGKAQGQELATLGININFSPLADLAEPGSYHLFDFRSRIGQRAIDSDPQRVTQAVIGYAHGLESSGVRATLKHFPGLGRVSGDTHIIPAALTASESELENSDWIPFKLGLQATQSLLMVGHATLPAVDPQKPASRSAKVIQGIVRNRWQHDGLLVTDDLAMGAALRQGACSVGIDALNAGIDLLLVSYDPDLYFTIFACILNARRDSQLSVAQLKASNHRITRWGQSSRIAERQTMIERQAL